MMAELMSLWKMVPIAIGLTPPSFLAMGISLAPKKYGLRCSGIKEEESVAIFLHSLQMALVASEFISLIMSERHPRASAAFFLFVFLRTHLKSADVKGVWGVVIQ